MAKSTHDDDKRHTLAIYRNMPRPLRSGRPTKEAPRQLIWFRRDLAPESIELLEELMRADLGPNCVLERDGVVVHEGPRVEERRERVEVGGYIPTTAPAPAELVECITKGAASPEVLATLTTATPSEAVLFSLDVLHESYMRTVAAGEEMIAREQRHVERVMKHQEWFLNLLQKNSELELELYALNKEEEIKEAERARARAEAKAEAQGKTQTDDGFSKREFVGLMRELLEALRGGRPHGAGHRN